MFYFRDKKCFLPCGWEKKKVQETSRDSIVNDDVIPLIIIKFKKWATHQIPTTVLLTVFCNPISLSFSQTEIRYNAPKKYIIIIITYLKCSCNSINCCFYSKLSWYIAFQLLNTKLIQATFVTYFNDVHNVHTNVFSEDVA